MHPLIQQLIDGLQVNFSEINNYNIYMLFLGHGLVARCSTPVSANKVLVMLAGSEWVLDNTLDVTQAITDIQHFVGNHNEQT